MAVFNISDFNVSTANQKQILRIKLDDLGKELVPYAKIACPNTGCWDNYVTGKTDYNTQWGAVCPSPVSQFPDLISSCPCIYFYIPQDGGNVWLAMNVEFKTPRERLVFHCSANNIKSFLSKIQSATGATVSVWKKEVNRNNHRQYEWDGYWDGIKLPEIDVSSCSIKYLDTMQKEIQTPKQHSNPEMIWEPIFLIKYEHTQYDLINYGTNIVDIFGAQVKILASILEYLIT
jgi:hypothetical protein